VEALDRPLTIAHGGATRPADRGETGGDSLPKAKEGQHMSTDLWLELVVVILKIVAAGLAR